MTKVMGQSSPMKPQAKKEQKKNSARNNQETWARENKMQAPKMKWAKFKKWTQIEDIAEHKRQPKCFWWSVILVFRKPFKEFHNQNILP